MLALGLIIAGVGVFLCLVGVVVWWVRRIDVEMDYPEARGPGLTEEEGNTLRLGIGLSGNWSNPGAH